MINRSDKTGRSSIFGTGVLILAAGGSSRFGSAKQLARYDGKTLIRRAAETALCSVADQVFVVIGGSAEEVRAAIGDLTVRIVFNPDWELGIGSSIRFGLEKIIESFPDIGRVLIVLADQPFLNSDHLDRLLKADGIAATGYQGGVGVPAAFDREFFPQLLALDGDQGAKSVIVRNLAVSTVFVDELSGIDIDTPADLDRIRNNSVTEN